MIKGLLKLGLSLVLSAVALLLAGWFIDGVHLEPAGFVAAVVIFSLIQAIAGPLVSKFAKEKAPAIVGGVGLISTLIALIVATLFPGGLHITGVAAWIATPVVVWVIGALGGWAIERFVLEGWWDRRVEAKRAAKRTA